MSARPSRLRFGQAEVGDRLLEHVVDPVERVVDLVGVLEDHLDIAQELATLLPVQLAHVNPSIEHLATGRLGEAEDQSRKGCLAAAALAHDGGDRRRRILDGERQIVERDHGIAAIEEPPTEDLGHMPGFEQSGHAASLRARKCQAQ